MIAWVDGRFLDDAVAAVPITDRGFLYADAVFETARLHDGGYFRLQRHLDRLERSAAIMRLALPPRAQIAGVAFELARRSALVEGTFRVTVTRGSGHGPRMVATLAPLADWRVRAQRGWRLVTARRRLPTVDAVPHDLKTTGRVVSLLARQEAADAGVDDVLMLTGAGAVAEGPTWNVFWRRGDTLFTPALETGVLDGVTRGEVVALAAALDVRLVEGIFARADLDRADEMMATMSSLGIVPIRQLDGRILPTSTTAARLQEAYWAHVAASVERTQGTDRASATGSEFLPDATDERGGRED